MVGMTLLLKNSLIPLQRLQINPEDAETSNNEAALLYWFR